MAAVAYQLNEFRVDLVLPDSYAEDYFDGFLDRAAPDFGGLPLVRINLHLGVPAQTPAMWTAEVSKQRVGDRLETASVAFTRESNGYHVWAPGVDPYHGLSAARRLLRDLWLHERMRRSPVAMLHASAVELNGKLIVFIGDKRAGKTSLLLSSTLRHGWRPMSNDCLVLYSRSGYPWVSGTPTYVSVRPDVERAFGTRLMEGIRRGHADLDSYRRCRLARRCHPPASLYVSTGSLGRPVLSSLRLQDLEVTVAQVEFRGPGDPGGISPLAQDPLEFLMENLKYTRLDQLPRIVKEPPVHNDLSDAGTLLSWLADKARFLRFRHDGDAVAILQEVNSRGWGEPL